MIPLEPILKRLGLSEPPCPVIWTSEHLRFWEGGAYFEEGDKRWIEIRPKGYFQFFGYSSEMILMHEWIHAIRNSMSDHKWEELIAYQVAPRWYQQFLGPLFSKKTFLTALGLTIALKDVSWLGAAPFLLTMAIFVQYLKLWNSFKKIKQRLFKKYENEEKAFCALIRLHPQELNRLAKKPTSCIGDL